jgi:CheY-like chemotaxis protein
MKNTTPVCNVTQPSVTLAATMRTKTRILLERGPPSPEKMASLPRDWPIPGTPAARGPASGPPMARPAAGGSPKALIVDADPMAAGAAADTVTSLGHGCDCVGSQVEARARLAAGRYLYAILDLAVPVRPGGNGARIQHGVNLLREIRADPALAAMPVISTLADHLATCDIAVWMIREGAADFVRKPYTDTGHTLEKAITNALARAREIPLPPFRLTPCSPTRKRGERAAAIEAIRRELIEHIRVARRHACDAAADGKGPDLLPRPLKKDLSRLLGLKPYTVARCFRDSPDLRALWAMAADIEQVMRLGGR